MLSVFGTLLLYILHSWHSTSLCLVLGALLTLYFLVLGALPTLYFLMLGAHGTLFLFA
jgi:hypothetical protein